MNNGFTPEKYAEIVNVYGSRLRAIAPEARIVACGQKRSNDMVWSQKVIDLAGENFDVLGCPQLRVRARELRDRAEAHPRLPLEAAGLRPRFGAPADRDRRPGVEPLAHLRLAGRTACRRQPDALRGAQPRSDDELPGPAHAKHDGRSDLDVVHLPRPRLLVPRRRPIPVEKLFREHYAERYLASTSGTFRDIPTRKTFFDEIATMKPEDWRPGTVDAIATASADGRRIVIKAVNYERSGTPCSCDSRAPGSPRRPSRRCTRSAPG